MADIIIGTVRVGATPSPSAEAAETPAGSPALPDDGDLYGMGLDVVAAALASRSAEATVKIAREGQRSAKLEQAAELRGQAQAMRAKASEMRSQAWTAGALSVAGGAFTVGAGMTATNAPNGGGLSQSLSGAGSATSGLAQPLGTLNGGAKSTELEADSTEHAARAKTAEGIADEFATLDRQSKAIIEKATSVIQSLLAERQATTRAILRTG